MRSVPEHVLRGPTRGLFACGWAGLFLLGPGCVTEEIAGPTRPSPAPHQARPPADLPHGPLATPVRDSSVTAQVTVGIIPIGSVPYDGQTLPLPSPDGRFLAVQDGQAPTWPTILATHDAEVPLDTRLAIYDLTRTPPARIPLATETPPGLILGRGSDARGFLVEAPQPDGSRWIGRLGWTDGRVRWLVRDEYVNAHAILSPEGHLIYTRRPVASVGSGSELVLRSAEGATAVRPAGDSDPGRAGASHLFPACTQERGIVYAFISSELGLEIAAIRLTRPERGPPAWGPVAARRLVVEADPGDHAPFAYQSIVSTPPALPARAADAGGSFPDPPLVLHHPALRRMVLFDRRNAAFQLLPPNTIAAASTPYSATPGYFVTAPEGLLFAADPARRVLNWDEPGRAPPVARVLPGEPHIARPTTDPNRPIILIGPTQRDPGRLVVAALRLEEDEGL